MRPWLKINKYINLGSSNYQTITLLLGSRWFKTATFAAPPIPCLEHRLRSQTIVTTNRKRGIVIFLPLFLNHHMIICRVIKIKYKIVLTLPKLSLKNKVLQTVSKGNSKQWYKTIIFQGSQSHFQILKALPREMWSVISKQNLKLFAKQCFSFSM